MKFYKHGNGSLVARASNGRFKKTYLSDLVEGVNTTGQVFICNVCGEEFIPVMLQGKCCDVNNKRPKPAPELSEEDKAIKAQIQAIRNKPFINRQDIAEVERLERQLSKPGKA